MNATQSIKSKASAAKEQLVATMLAGDAEAIKADNESIPVLAGNLLEALRDLSARVDTLFVMLDPITKPAPLHKEEEEKLSVSYRSKIAEQLQTAIETVQLIELKIATKQTYIEL